MITAIYLVTCDVAAWTVLALIFAGWGWWELAKADERDAWRQEQREYWMRRRRRRWPR